MFFTGRREEAVFYQLHSLLHDGASIASVTHAQKDLNYFRKNLNVTVFIKILKIKTFVLPSSTKLFSIDNKNTKINVKIY